MFMRLAGLSLIVVGVAVALSPSARANNASVKSQYGGQEFGS